MFEPTPPAPPKGPFADRTRAIIVGVAVLFMALYWVSVARGLAKNEQDALADAQRRAVFSAQAAAEAVETTLDRFQVSLRVAATAALEGPRTLALYGQSVAGADDMVFQLFHVDAEGYLTYTSLGPAPRNYLADREYFKALAENPSTTFVVSGPMLGRLTNRWSLQLAYAVRDKGKFAGVVAVAVSPDRWTERLSKFDAGPRDVLSLFSGDGIYLLRTLDSQQSYGQQVPANRPFVGAQAPESGTYVERGARDGVLRVYAWKRLTTGQVMVSGVALDDAVAPVRAMNRQTVIRGAAASAVLLTALVFIIHLIGRSQRASLAIAEKEYQQRVTLSAMAEGLAVVAPSGQILFHNDSFARILPYSGDQLRRTGAYEAWDVVDEHGRALDLSQLPGVVTARTGIPCDNVIVGLRTDGKTHWLNTSTRPLLDAQGRTTAAILTMTDITAEREAERRLRESEERYRTVVDSLEEAIVVQNRDGHVVASNPAAERILGLDLDGAGGRSTIRAGWRAILPDGRELAPEDFPVAQTLRTGHRVEGFVLGLVKPDRTTTWVEINTAPLGAAAGDGPSAVVASVLDITNRKEFEDELSRSNAELEQFAYAVSHDLREPLRMVASYMQLLQRRLGTTLDEEGTEFIGFAVDGAKRMDRMLVALLEYSRVGRIGQPMDWVSSRRVLDEALLFLKPVIERTDASLHVEGDWPEILASADEMERLFQNLVGNALKYCTPETKPVICIGSGLKDGEWRFTVADNGIGIAADQTGRLFKVFQRLHANNRYEGSGVGLALCRKIVHRHDGRIWVESDGPGQGSTFIVALPLGVIRFAGPVSDELAPAMPVPAV